jgi:structural maintenance of chromosome 1
MDAISFVLGVRTGQLRGNNLQELIYKGPEDTPAADSAYVKLTFVDDNDKEILFQRTIKREGKDSRYSINGKTYSAENYEKRLKDLSILVKARNFLVFQVTNLLCTIIHSNIGRCRDIGIKVT